MCARKEQRHTKVAVRSGRHKGYFMCAANAPHCRIGETGRKADAVHNNTSTTCIVQLQSITVRADMKTGPEYGERSALSTGNLVAPSSNKERTSGHDRYGKNQQTGNCNLDCLYLGESGRLDSRANRAQAGEVRKERGNMRRRQNERREGNGLVEK